MPHAAINASGTRKSASGDTRACARIEWRPRNRQAQARNVDKPVAVPRSGPKAVVAATSVSGSSETRRLVESAILFSEPGI